MLLIVERGLDFLHQGHQPGFLIGDFLLLHHAVGEGVGKALQLAGVVVDEGGLGIGIEPALTLLGHGRHLGVKG